MKLKPKYRCKECNKVINKWREICYTCECEGKGEEE